MILQLRYYRVNNLIIFFVESDASSLLSVGPNDSLIVDLTFVQDFCSRSLLGIMLGALNIKCIVYGRSGLAVTDVAKIHEGR